MGVDGMRINTILQDLHSSETPRGVEGYGTETILIRQVDTEAILRHSYEEHARNINISSADNRR
jgi:hypothetical protein